MIEINPKWTLIKQQLSTDLKAVPVKTKEKLVEKINQAVKSVLEIIAPEQIETQSDGDILKCLQAAVIQSHSSND